MTSAQVWVVGRGGLLGRAVERALAPTMTSWHPSVRVPWGTPAAAEVLVSSARAFGEQAVDGWWLFWCAGAGVTSTGAADLAAEVEMLRLTLDVLDDRACGPRTVFLASSAGGLYAGAGPSPPFTEHTTPRPLAPYGEAKLRAEEVVRAWAGRTGGNAVIGRIANLYGPGQDLAKPQGLISQLCRSHLTGQPISLYVPLDTRRDYLYVDDAAALVVDAVRTADRLSPGSVVVKVVASQRSVTIGALLGEMRRVLRRAPRVVLGASPSARFQVIDLGLRSVVWPMLDARTLTPLPAGINATLEDLRAAQRAGQL